MSTSEQALRSRIRLVLCFFIIALVISGATAIPLETELNLAVAILEKTPLRGTAFDAWITRVRDALTDTNARHPFLAYGTDWLAFGHFVIAIAFLGPWRDPVKNVWVIEFGIIACLLIVPYALVCGGVRGVPLGWRLIDCSFGVFGIVPLLLCRRWIRRLAYDAGREP